MTIQRIDSGKGHWYKVDGEKADGVTTLLGDGLAKPALINWAANTTAGYAIDHWAELDSLTPSQRLDRLKKARWAELDKAARRGTEVHGLADRLSRGEEVDVPEEIAGHVESCVRFFDEWQPRVVLTETVVASRRWRYCGTLDAVFDLPDGRRVIIDYKTSRSGIFPETALQLAAYRYADVYLDADGEKSMADLGIQAAFGIWIRADGYDVYELDAGEQTYKDFLHVAWIARWTKRNRALISASLSAPAREENVA